MISEFLLVRIKYAVLRGIVREVTRSALNHT
jgi:hypothetical protein